MVFENRISVGSSDLERDIVTSIGRLRTLCLIKFNFCLSTEVWTITRLILSVEVCHRVSRVN